MEQRKPNKKENIMGLFGLFKSSKTMLVVDGLSLNEALGMKGKVPPRNQLQMLRRLSRFAEREKMGMVVVLAGSPLHKAPSGKKFEGITVLYSKSPAAHAKHVAKVAASKGAGTIVVSGNAAVEKIALGRGLGVMRVSTFRKAFDFGGSESDGSSRPERGGSDRNNRNRPPRRRQQKQSSGEKKPERPPKESSESDAINELIDLVD
jgi:hypothetical protein